MRINKLSFDSSTAISFAHTVQKHISILLCFQWQISGFFFTVQNCLSEYVDIWIMARCLLKPLLVTSITRPFQFIQRGIMCYPSSLTILSISVVQSEIEIHVLHCDKLPNFVSIKIKGNFFTPTSFDCAWILMRIMSLCVLNDCLILPFFFFSIFLFLPLCSIKPETSICLSRLFIFSTLSWHSAPSALCLQLLLKT